VLRALSGLTTRGRCLLAAGIAAAVCSFVLNERDLLRVAVFVVALPLLVAVFISATRLRIGATRALHPQRVAVGGAERLGQQPLAGVRVGMADRNAPLVEFDTRRRGRAGIVCRERRSDGARES